MSDGGDIEAFHLIDAIHSPFAASLALYSDKASVDLASYVGKPHSASLPLPDGKNALFWGIVTAARQEETTPQATRSTLELRPWIALLADAPSCAVHQNKTVPEIVRETCKKQGFADIGESLSKKHPKREFAVQYNESTLDFLSRIMAEEGIFYYFEHDKQKHILTLADDASGLAKLPDMQWRGANIPETPDNIVWDVRPERRAVIASVAVDDCNYLTPKTSLSATGGSGAPGCRMYGTGHSKQQEGGEIARRFHSAAASRAFVLRGKTRATAMRVGGVFALKNCPIKELNASWAVVELDMHVRRDGGVEASFVAVPPTACQPPLPARPRVVGPLTAIVTGKSGADATTDEYGRVKARFHWDRDGKNDETSSCWLRVVQPWAGAGYGAFFLPRAGQEVLVEFLDGNPDRPVIAGCLYNGEAKPPWKLPDNSSVSGIRGRSIGGGGAGNEISLDDKKDKERLYVHAQKLLECLVEDARSVTVSGDDSLSVKGKRRIKIDGDYEVTVGGKLVVKAGSVAFKSEKGAFEVDAKTGITLKADTSLKATASAGVSLETKAALKLEGANVSVTGKMAAIDGGGMLQLKGGMVKIN